MRRVLLILILVLGFQPLIKTENVRGENVDKETSKASLLFSQITGSSVAICEAYLLGYITQEESTEMIKAYLNRLDKTLGSDWLNVPRLEAFQEQKIYKPSMYVKGIIMKKFPKCSKVINN